jgi:hypothetical protein
VQSAHAARRISGRTTSALRPERSCAVGGSRGCFPATSELRTDMCLAREVRSKDFQHPVRLGDELSGTPASFWSPSRPDPRPSSVVRGYSLLYRWSLRFVRIPRPRF